MPIKPTECGKWLVDLLTTATLDGVHRVTADDLMALGVEFYRLQRIEQAATDWDDRWAAGTADVRTCTDLHNALARHRQTEQR